jgi:hypothetical protein
VNDADLIEVSCPRCQKRQKVARDQAGKRVPCSNASCRTPIEIPQPTAPVSESRPVAPFSMLRALGLLFQALAILALAWALGGVVFGLRAAFAVPLDWPPLMGAALAISLGLLACVACLSAAEFIKLAVNVEAHLRATRTALAREELADGEKVPD